MGIKFGEIDANQILENEFRINVLEQVLAWIMQNNSRLVLQVPSQEIILQIRRDVVKVLQQKYPLSDVQLKG